MSQSQLVALPFVHLSAFADDVNSGNPAVVVFPSPEQDARLDDAARVAISANFNQPMTAFIVPHVEQNGETPLPAHARAFDIQYFTVADKVPLCGHATLCAASALFSDVTRVSPDTTELYFIAENGKIVARKAEEGRIEIAIKAGEVSDFIEGDPREAQLRGAIEKAIGGQAKVVYAGVGRDHLDWYALVELDAPDLGALDVDSTALLKSPFRVHVLTARGQDPKFSFVSRMFAPKTGVTEDPVCGTAHTLLGPYWAAKDGFEDKLDGAGVFARQVSKRGGDLRISRKGDTINLAGKVIALTRGEAYA